MRNVAQSVLIFQRLDTPGVPRRLFSQKNEGLEIHIKASQGCPQPKESEAAHCRRQCDWQHSIAALASHSLLLPQKAGKYQTWGKSKNALKRRKGILRTFKSLWRRPTERLTREGRDGWGVKPWARWWRRQAGFELVGDCAKGAKKSMALGLEIKRLKRVYR